MALAELVKTVRTYFENRNGGPGVALNLEGTGLGGLGLNAEIYQAPGLVSVPPKGTRGIFLPVGKGRRSGYIVAMHNYNIVITTGEGGTVLFSTSQDGKTVKARVEVDNLGKVKLSNATQSLKTIMDSLSTALSAFCTTCATSPDAVLVGAAATLAASVTAYKAQLALLLKD